MMLSRRSKKFEARNILVITLSNIGDVVLTCPVIDSLLDRFPQADVSVVVGPKARGIFERNPYLREVYVFDRRQSWGAKVKWIWGLRKRSFDMVIDLRHTAIPFFLSPRYRTAFLRRLSLRQEPMLQKHLSVLKTVVPDVQRSRNRHAFFISDEQQIAVRKKFKGQINFTTPFFVVAPGSANPDKRWPPSGFIFVINELNKRRNFSTVFVGDQSDALIADEIINQTNGQCVNLCGQISLLECAVFIKNSSFSLVNDSAALHISSYFNTPVVALFGPSDPVKYGPWGSQGFYLKAENKKDQICADIKDIEPEKVIEVIFSKLL